jgi:RND family efflux transporter MFP subunit
MSFSKKVRQFPDQTMHVSFAFSRIRPILMIGSFALFLVACDSGNSYKPPPPPNVTVSHPQRDQVIDAIEFTGNTQAFYTVQLRARVDGYLEKVLFKEGDIVDEGKTLFLIQQQSYIAKVKEAEANLLSAKAKLMHSETEFTRYTGLMKEEAAAQTDVDHWHYERDSNRAAVMANEAQLDIAKLNLSYTTVKAPFRGKVSRRYADPGNVVGHGEETVLAEINKIDPLYVYFTISERDLLKIRQTMEKSDADRRANPSPNMPIHVGLANEEGYPHEALLDYADIQIDPSTGTMQLRATLPNSDLKLLPGLFVRIRAEKPGVHEGVLVPEDAVAFDQAGAYVLIVDEQGVVSRRGVELGALDHKRYEVTTGLTDDEWVIVNGQMRAIPGKKVSPVKLGETQGSANP